MQDTDTGEAAKVYFSDIHTFYDTGQITSKKIRKAHLNHIFKLARAVIDYVVLVRV